MQQGMQDRGQLEQNEGMLWYSFPTIPIFTISPKEANDGHGDPAGGAELPCGGRGHSGRAAGALQELREATQGNTPRHDDSRS